MEKWSCNKEVFVGAISWRKKRIEYYVPVEGHLAGSKDSSSMELAVKSCSTDKVASI